jgi:hypothetical protein
VNEQFPEYWAALFEEHGYRPLDVIRGRIWHDAQVLWWLRQNTLLFVHDRLLENNARLQAEAAVCRPLSIVHPAHFLSVFRRGNTSFDGISN